MYRNERSFTYLFFTTQGLFFSICSFNTLNLRAECFHNFAIVLFQGKIISTLKFFTKASQNDSSIVLIVTDFKFNYTALKSHAASKQLIKLQKANKILYCCQFLLYKNGKFLNHSLQGAKAKPQAGLKLKSIQIA